MGIAGRKDDVDDASTYRTATPCAMSVRIKCSPPAARPPTRSPSSGSGARQAASGRSGEKRSQHLAGEDAWKTQEPTPRQKPQDTEKKKVLSGRSQTPASVPPIIARASERGVEIPWIRR